MDNINELFENPKDIARQIDKEPSAEAQSSIGISDMQVYHDSDGEKYVKYKRAGAIELHHMSKDGESGKITNSTKFNSKYIATMMNLITPDLKSGNTVRISAVNRDGMIDHYHRMAKVLAKKHQVSVTPLEKHPTEENSMQFYIQPSVEEGLFMIQSMVRNDLLIEWSNKFDNEGLSNA